MTDPATTSNVPLMTRQRNSLEQAAILLLSIGEDAAAKVMQKLSREEVMILSETMARLQGLKCHKRTRRLIIFLMTTVNKAGSMGDQGSICKICFRSRWGRKSQPVS